MRYVVSAGLALATCLVLAIGPANAQPPASAKCQTCHGVVGNSTDGKVPRLNGQRAEYLARRLKDFLDPDSQDPHATDAMWGIVRQINDETLASLAAYYAGQQPTAARPTGQAALIAAGRRFYATGNAAEAVPACAACHGAHGEGAGAVPRLAGQHGAYLRAQLERFRLNLRASGAMHPKTNNITDHEIDSLVAYLADD